MDAISANEAAVAKLPIHAKRKPQTNDGNPPFRAAVALDVKTASQVAIIVVPKPSRVTSPKLRYTTVSMPRDIIVSLLT